MEGAVRVASTLDAESRWHKAFLKLDDIAAQLVCFKDKQQMERKWTLPLHNADISTPIPGAPTQGGIAVDSVPFCICITTPTSSAVAYVAVHDDASKKAWSTALLRVSQTGPQDAKFSKNDEAKQDFVFSARVSEYRISNRKAEYKVRCCARFLNKAYNRKLSTEWDVWRRYSLFSSLDSDVRRVLPLTDILLPPRLVLQSLLGKSLVPAFLDDRRAGLDTYICKICDLREAVAFFQSGANATLKTFFEFDDHCKQEDVEFTKKEAQSRHKETPAQPKKKKPQAAPMQPPPPPTSPPSEATVSAATSSPEKPATKPHKKSPKTTKKNKKTNKGVRGPEVSTETSPEPVPDTKQFKQATAPATPATPTPTPLPDRGNLLAQIQQGTKLKRVQA